MNPILSQKFDILTWAGEVKNVALSDIISSNTKTLLYFYPKDNTPGCTLENKDFTCLKAKFQELWITLVWVSKDSIESHKKFVLWHGLENDLISDPTLELHKAFWSYGEKNNYGKIIQGVIRSTVLLDNKWDTIKIWNNVKATGHAEKMLRELSK